MDGDKKDSHLQNILDDLNEDQNLTTFNRKYFDNSNSATPQNTPSAKNAPGFSLKNIDFSKYMEDQENQYDSYVPNDQRHELNFCDPTYVGDGTVELGCTQGDANLKICNTLLCTKCDVKISMFKNTKWCENCDYLFFRNNYGDQIKLSEKLVSAPNNSCYSCQCSWVNIDEKLVNVENLSTVSWTCGGHVSQ